MRVCLVSPPAITELRDQSVCATHAGRLIAESAPLGVLTLAALVAKAGIPIEVVDLNLTLATYVSGGDDPTLEHFAAAVAGDLLRNESSVYGFNTMWSTYPFMLRLAATIKTYQPDSVIVFGGPQASLVDIATIERFPEVDFIVRGEADETFPQLLDALVDGCVTERIRGLTYRNGGRTVRTEDAPPVSNLDALPWPAFQLHPAIAEGAFLPLELGRGCPFGCTFCSTNDFFNRRFRLKSPEVLIEQMRWLHRAYGCTRFDLIHDMFTANKRRVIEICDALRSIPEDFHWYCSARTDCVDDSMLDHLYDAGCRGIFFGIETGSPRLQKIVGKNLDLDEAMARVRYSASKPMRTTISLIAGFPEEEKDDLRATINLIVDSLKLEYVDPQLHLLAALNGTPVSRQYAGVLELDDIYSDLSQSGWSQTEQDRELILAHPDIFQPFFSPPLFRLDRPYVQELRTFLLHAIGRFRWVLVAIREEIGDVVEVFEEWKAWECRNGSARSGLDLLRFYATDAFVGDFISFLRSRYGEEHRYRKVHAMVEYVQIVEAGLAEETAVQQFPVQGPRRAEQTHVLEIPSAIIDVLAELRGASSGDLDSPSVVVATRPVGSRFEMIHLSPLLADVLKKCNGVQDIDDLIEGIPDSLLVDGIDRSTVGRMAIAELHRERLVTYA